MLTRIENLLTEIYEYLKTRGELVKINVLEKTSRILAWIIYLIIGLLVVLFAVAFIAVGITLLLSKVMPLWAACLVSSGIFIALLVLLIAFRNKFVVNPIVRMLSSIMYNDDFNPEDEENV
ncbi:MAG: phage holin family protein [Paludibacteraceae bacterium]|nr:phage holin family protein [Paludibacteraceae bacterium]